MKTPSEMAVFLRGRNEVIMPQSKTIYCPRCGGELMGYGGKGVIPLSSKCVRCNKRAIYTPTSNTVRITNVPPRTTGSGMRFY